MPRCGRTTGRSQLPSQLVGEHQHPPSRPPWKGGEEGAVAVAGSAHAMPPCCLCPAVVRILEVPEEGEVAIVGTLYKEMKLKPSILDE